MSKFAIGERVLWTWYCGGARMCTVVALEGNGERKLWVRLDDQPEGRPFIDYRPFQTVVEALERGTMVPTVDISVADLDEVLCG